MSPLRIAVLALLVVAGQAFADDAGKKARKAKPSAPASSAKAAGQQNFVPGGVASSFVIPKNTCESGTSIQKLLTDKPPPDKTK